jgi:hypothetical protein
LYLLSPLALFQCTLLALYFGEIEEIRNRFLLYRFTGPAIPFSDPGNSNLTLHVDALNATLAGVDAGIDAHTFGSIMPGVFGLAINALMAFALNVVSFHTNRKVGALGMSVAGMWFWIYIFTPFVFLTRRF